MKVSALIAKLQALPPDADLTLIDVWRLFDDDTVTRAIRTKFDRVKECLARGDMDGLREFVDGESQSRGSRETHAT